MNKCMSSILVVVSAILLCVLLCMYSFSTIQVSEIFYLMMWCGCIGMIRFATGFGFRFEE